MLDITTVMKMETPDPDLAQRCRTGLMTESTFFFPAGGIV
jgi:hypothetical protein